MPIIWPRRQKLLVDDAPRRLGPFDRTEHAQSGGMDFSAHGVKSRYESGYKAVDKFFARENVAKQSATSEANSLHAA